MLRLKPLLYCSHSICPLCLVHCLCLFLNSKHLSCSYRISHSVQKKNTKKSGNCVMWVKEQGGHGKLMMLYSIELGWGSIVTTTSYFLLLLQFSVCLPTLAHHAFCVWFPPSLYRPRFSSVFYFLITFPVVNSVFLCVWYCSEFFVFYVRFLLHSPC